MKKTSIIILYLCLFLISLQAEPYSFLRLDNTNGLSNNQVEHIFKDSKGFMWFVTNSGLNRYDGQSIKVYRPNKKDSNSLSSDRIYSIQEDIYGNLWLHNRFPDFEVFNIHEEKFIHNVDSVLASYGLPENPELIRIYEKREMYIYYPQKGLYSYDLNSKKIRHFEQSKEREISKTDDIQAMQVSDKYIWILFKNGLLECLDKDKGIINYTDTYFKQQVGTSTIIKTIMIDSDGDLWLYPGVADKGIAYLNTQNREWTFLDQESTKILSNSFVRCIIQDKNGLFWIGTDHGGVNIFDKRINKTIATLTNNIYDDSSISQNSIISAFCDDKGTVWVGTYKNGISYYNPHLLKFNKPDLFYKFRKNSETFDCNSLYKDKNGYLWIGTNGAGLIQYDEKQNKEEIFRHKANDPQTISSNIITNITADYKGVLWIGTFLGGMNAYNGQSFRRYQIDEQDSNSLSSRSVYGITEDKKQNLWIATLGGGVNKLDSTRSIFSRYNVVNTNGLSSDYVLSVFKNRDGDIYFASDRGFDVIRSNSEEIESVLPKKLMEDSLTSIISNNLIVDSRDILWIATDNGINIYNPHTKSFQYINGGEGLPSEEIVSLVEDNFGNIWAGTRNGLVHIECSYRSNKLEYTLSYFDEKDGLPGSVCNQNAIFKDVDGKIYIGTTKGYVSFYPNEIKLNKVPPKPQFTELFISNQIIRPNVEYKKRIIIEKSITDLDEVKLRYDETNFSITFSAMNYIHSEKNIYKYKLQGLDKDWIIGEEGVGIASYSNLNPGKYKLIVYASNEDGIWSEDPIEMNIIVIPPFWMSWWAYLIYFFAILSIIWIFSKYRLNKQKEEFAQKQQILEIQKTHEVDELKFKFFTNISHEFKTPITLILSPLDKLLKEETDSEHRKLLSIIKRNALNLLTMVNEILEFRKLDLNKTEINLTQNDIIDFTKQICSSFTTLADQKGISFTFTSYFDSLQIEFDYEKMHKIIVNLISNAFKYTDEGEININIGINDDPKSSVKKLLITVSDTGIGVEKEFQPKIFDRFFRVENKQTNNLSGTGVGLHLVSEYVKMHDGEITIDSELGKGSVFTVIIPVSDSVKTDKLKDATGNISFEKELSEVEQEKINSVNLSNKGSLPLLMIVDDNEDMRTFISDLFSESYNVIMTEDGCEASSLVMDQLPDIILCDVMMPKMDGYEFCRKIREDVRTSHIPIILLTAKSSDESKYQGIEAGADDYISKPFNIDLLKLKIAKIIDKQKSIQQKFKQRIDISPSEIEIISMDEKFVKKAVEFVEKNISDSEFLVEDLCKEMAMSRVYFYKKILALTGKTPSEFIRFIRLKRAADLLKKSQLFVNEVAFQVGFNDPKYFRKYFKEEFGVPPNEYKKQHGVQ